MLKFRAMFDAMEGVFSFHVSSFSCSHIPWVSAPITKEGNTSKTTKNLMRNSYDNWPGKEQRYEDTDVEVNERVWLCWSTAQCERHIR